MDIHCASPLEDGLIDSRGAKAGRLALKGGQPLTWQSVAAMPRQQCPVCHASRRLCGRQRGLGRGSCGRGLCRCSALMPAAPCTVPRHPGQDVAQGAARHSSVGGQKQLLLQGSWLLCTQGPKMAATGKECRSPELKLDAATREGCVEKGNEKGREKTKRTHKRVGAIEKRRAGCSSVRGRQIDMKSSALTCTHEVI